MPNPGPATTISPHQLLQADSSDGYLFGTLSTTPIGMYGVTPVAQRSNANQLTVSSNATAGTLIAAQSLVLSALNSVTPNSTVTYAFTMTGTPVVSTDFLVVNKPSAQAGLGILNARPQSVSGSTIVVQYLNNLATGITPTASESYSIANFRGLATSIVLTPSGVPANSTSEQTFNVTGVAVGELVMVSKAADQIGIGVAGMRAAGNNQIAITFINNSSAPITPTAGETYSYVATGGMAANSNVIVYGVNVGTLAPPVTTTTQSWAVTEQAVTVSSVLASDIFIGVSKPSAQGNMAVVGGRITAANTVQLAFAAGTVTGVSPTPSEVYGVTLYRQNAQPPFSVLSVTIAPTAVGPNTTGEQSFTVSPAVAQSIVWVNKPSFTQNIGVVGCRMTSTAAGSVSITFANASITATITPPTEVYTFGIIGPSAQGGSHAMFSVANGVIGTNQQSNELRLALANIGMITGGTP